MRIAVVVLIAAACATPAHAEGSCNFTRQDNIEHCGVSLECLNAAFHNIEMQVKAKLGQGDARKSLSGKLAQRSYELEERYRTSFCEGVWHGSVEFWNVMDNKPIESTRPPSATERDQLRRTAAVCNISVLADYLYRLQTEYCVNE